jgi:hypothetical protein
MNASSLICRNFSNIQRFRSQAEKTTLERDALNEMVR